MRTTTVAILITLASSAGCMGGEPEDGHEAYGFALALSSERHPNPNCPPPTRRQGAVCVLEADAVLTETLELGSFTKLDCKHHRLLPHAAGSGTTPATYVPSVPEIAVAIVGQRGVNLQQCIIGTDAQRFDFGVLVADSKNPGNGYHKIVDNEMHVRQSAAMFFNADDNLFSDNVVTSTVGMGIVFPRDSDRNRILNNTVENPVLPPIFARWWPSVPAMLEHNLTDGGIAVGIPIEFAVINIVVNGRLLQFPNFDFAAGVFPRNEGNRIEGNFISLPGATGPRQRTGLEVARMSSDNVVRGNTVHEAATGIRLAGGMAAFSVRRPARCIDADGQGTDRYCGTNADCFIAPIDAAPVGTCPAVVPEVINALSMRTVTEDNVLVGPFNHATPVFAAGIAGGNGARDGIIRNNHIQDAGPGSGITLQGFMTLTGVVTGNVVTDATSALVLGSGPAATRFGAQVFLNTFTGSTGTAVTTDGVYLLPTELSWMGIGNYWGHTKPPCFSEADSVNFALIHDSNALCSPPAAPIP